MSKFCTNCGNEIPEGGDICLKCGKMQNNKKQNNNSNSKVNIMGVISFALSMIGFFTSFICIGIIFGIPALVLAIIGLVTSKKNNTEKGFAIAGLVISIISIIISFIYIIIVVGFFFMEGSSEIRNEIDNEACGSGYTLTNGRNVTGSYEYDEWYCCPNTKTKNTRNCREL